MAGAVKTGETAPVVHGRWTWDVDRELYVCSACGGGLWWTPPRYCPDCGARMDEEAEREKL